MTNISSFFDKGFWQGIVGSVFFALLGWCVSLVRTYAGRAIPKAQLAWNKIFLVVLFAMFAVMNTTILVSCAKYQAMITFIISSGFLFFFAWKEVSQFWKVGCVGATSKVKLGINYRQSLTIAKNGLSFLGIGASKLTELNNFENAVRRCNRPNKPVRFLLLNPNNDLLIEAAQRKGEDQHSYQRRVQQSLQKLKSLKEQSRLNIEVRFYTTPLPTFRLMFVNNSICLLSYYVLGEGDGSELPQLHIKGPPETRDTYSFYYPFAQYYEQIWSSSVEWDFQLPMI